MQRLPPPPCLKLWGDMTQSNGCGFVLFVRLDTIKCPQVVHGLVNLLTKPSGVGGSAMLSAVYGKVNCERRGRESECRVSSTHVLQWYTCPTNSL